MSAFQRQRFHTKHNQFEHAVRLLKDADAGSSSDSVSTDFFFFSLIMVKLQTLAVGSPASPPILSHNPSFFCEDGENATYLF